MNAVRLSLAVSSCVVGLVSASPSQAAGWFIREDCAPGTRHARAEYAAEHRNARRLQDLDCAGLTRFAETYRMTINEQIRATSYRPVAERAPDTGPPPQAAPLPSPIHSDSPVFSSPLPPAPEIAPPAAGTSTPVKP